MLEGCLSTIALCSVLCKTKAHVFESLPVKFCMEALEGLCPRNGDLKLYRNSLVRHEFSDFDPVTETPFCLNLPHKCSPAAPAALTPLLPLLLSNQQKVEDVSYNPSRLSGLADSHLNSLQNKAKAFPFRAMLQNWVFTHI